MSENDILGVLAGILAAFLILAIVIMIVGIVLVAVVTACQWILFKKAGEPGWASLIPIYNVFVMSKISFGDYRWAIAWVITYAVYVVLTMMRSFVMVFSDSDIMAFVMLFVAFIGIIVSLAMTAISCINLFFFGKAYGKSTPFCVLLLFFSPILLIVMALDKNTQYVGYSDFGKELYDKIRSKF